MKREKNSWAWAEEWLVRDSWLENCRRTHRNQFFRYFSGEFKNLDGHNYWLEDESGRRLEEKSEELNLVSSGLDYKSTTSYYDDRAIDADYYKRTIDS